MLLYIIKIQRKRSLALADTGKLGDTKVACLAIRRSEERFRNVGGVSMEMIAKLIPELGGHPDQICRYFLKIGYSVKIVSQHI